MKIPTTRQKNKHWLRPKWRKIREKVFGRDNYQCVGCGSADNLIGHHMIYLNMNRPLEWLDVVTLCQSCHRLIHKNSIESRDLNKKVGTYWITKKREYLHSSK